MRRNHPDLNCGALLPTAALVATLCLCGCGANRQTASINPFLGPGRVPPPATRMVPAGTAQPYYPGDPLPTMQSAASGAASPQLAAATGGAEGPSMQLASSNEPSVSIPIDNGALRFAAPKAQSEPTPSEPAPFTPAPGSMPIPVLQATVAAAQTAQAAYAEPHGPALSANALAVSPSGPWRSPRVPVATPSPSTAAPMIAPISAPAPPIWSAAPSSMDVRLRAVPSPPLEPVAPGAPRIRLPGPPLQSQVYVMPDGSIQHVSYTVVPVSPPGDGMQAPNVASGPQPQLASRDGFRPRGSVR